MQIKPTRADSPDVASVARPKADAAPGISGYAETRRLNRIALILAAAATLVAAIVLVAGWLGHFEVVVRLHPSFPAMVPSSALGLLFGGLGVLAHVLRLDRRLSFVFGLLVLAVLIAEAFVGDLSLGSQPGDAMSFATRLGLVGLAVVLILDLSPKAWTRRLRVHTNTVLLSLMSIPLIAYVINAASIWNNHIYTSMALHTALCLAALFAAMLCGNARGTWVMILAEQGPGSKMARRMLPVVVVTTIILFRLALWATDLNFVSSDFRLSVLAFAQIATISAAVLYFARVNNEAERRTRAAEAQTLQAEADLMRSETRRLKNEVDLARTQRMDTLGRLVGGVAHDFNNLLNVIGGNLKHLERTHPEAFASDTVQDATTAVADGTHLTRQLLAYGRQSQLSPGLCNIDDVAQQTLDMFRRIAMPGVTAELDVAQPGLAATLDATALRQALLNLLLNARDAMPEGGIVRVRLARAILNDADMPRFADGEPLDAGSYITVAVSDTGTGIAPDLLTHVTEPFFSTKKLGEGSGLGLSMVLGYCRQSDGNLTIDTRDGVGTTVTMWFPAD
ncbi:hypothetical protein DKT77_02130 [Meridianimarinicoccus roseus]|uniref:histidine kinase n=1 Tax=Meridianimarinicoccus roseus TaxID=2072018 RepID=A0A2V2LS91_9RHOB|nr:ATP-binding protein [Meridianimarinicoccus roseus]PWR04313.1 hypothetical protein DKT77_02130 [Meridianimarinicoccus roseus]